MIVRRHHDRLLLITQPDHAALAGYVMANWEADGLPQHPRRDLILLATREHDSGWLHADSAPIVDERSGRILDFVTAPDDVRQSVWPIAVERLSATPYAAALVAQHALTVYEHNRALAPWQPFFAKMEDLRHRCLSRSAPLTLPTLVEDYRFVFLGDRVSLSFATGRRDPWVVDAYELHVEPDRVAIRPDPFDGRAVPFTLSGRLLADVPYAKASDAAAAFTKAPVATLEGVAIGS